MTALGHLVCHSTRSGCRGRCMAYLNCQSCQEAVFIAYTPNKKEYEATSVLDMDVASYKVTCVFMVRVAPPPLLFAYSKYTKNNAWQK